MALQTICHAHPPTLTHTRPHPQHALEQGSGARRHESGQTCPSPPTSYGTSKCTLRACRRLLPLEGFDTLAGRLGSDSFDDMVNMPGDGLQQCVDDSDLRPSPEHLIMTELKSVKVSKTTLYFFFQRCPAVFLISGDRLHYPLLAETRLFWGPLLPYRLLRSRRIRNL